jgi:hypothetical protein
MPEHETRSASAQGERPTVAAARSVGAAADAEAPATDDAIAPRKVKTPVDSARDGKSN